MKWLNWPPAKGPKPPELERKIEYEIPNAIADTFRIRQSREAREERLLVVEASLDLKYRELGGVDKNPTIEWIRPRTPASKLPARFSADVDYSVSEIAKLDFETANQFVQGVALGARLDEIAPRMVMVDLVYPLSVGVRMKIKPYTVSESLGDDSNGTYYRAMSVGYILWAIARQYEHVYENWKKHGIWGHGLEELRFTKLYVNGGRGRVEVRAE
jgi:hypothetical protein